MDAPSPPSSASPEDDDEIPVAAPAVQAIVVAHEPGPWFEECLASLGAQEYPALEILVVDAGSPTPIAERVARALPGATLRRLDAPLGFGPSVNAVLDDVAHAPFLLICHDDVRLRPDAVRCLVEEAYRSNGGVLGPKQVAWEEERVLVHVGAAIDKTGVPAPFTEVGELDQEQHDAVRDVALVPGGVQLVRTDLLRALGGFDPVMDLLGEDLDLCWRATVAGARVLIVPDAVVAHRASLTERRGVDDRRRRLARYRLRTSLICYGRWHRMRVLPQAAVLALIEAVVALAFGHLAQARDVVGAWLWNLQRLGDIRARRRHLRSLRRVPDREVRALQVRGSARLNAFVRGQIGSDQRRGGLVGLQRTLSEPGLRVVVFGWAGVALLLGFGTRHLITRGTPTIGDFAHLPGGTDVLARVLAAYSDSWAGADAAAPTPLVLLAVPTMLLGGGWLREVLILGLLPIAALGIWRLATPLGARRVAVAAVLLYLAVPVGTDALSIGSWRGLLAYAAAPWLLLRLASAARLEPFGAASHSWARDVVTTGVLIGLVGAFDPATIAAVAVLVLGLVVGGLLALAPRGLLRLLTVTAGALVVAVALQGPYALELARAGWVAAMGPRALGESTGDLGAYLRLTAAGAGGTALGYGLLAAAAVPLLIGRGWRFVWAVRSWCIALLAIGVSWAGSEGWLPIVLPEAAVLLAAAGVGLTLAAALGLTVVVEDLPDYHLGWRQLAAGVGLVGALVFLFPYVGRTLDGRWELPRGSFDEIMAFADDGARAPDGAGRVLWLGDPAVLRGDRRDVIEGTAAVVTDEATSSLVSMWPVNPTVPDEALRVGLRDALLGHSGRLGQTLAVHGIEWIVAPQQSVPAPFGGVRAPTDPHVLDALRQQLDLARVDVNVGVVVYRNEAFVPMVATLEQDGAADQVAAARPGELVATTPALRARAAYPGWRGAVGEGRVVRLASGSRHWTLRVEGAPTGATVAGDGVLAFRPAGPGAASLGHEPIRLLQLGAVAQGVAWILGLAALLRWRSRDESDAALRLERAP